MGFPLLPTGAPESQRGSPPEGGEITQWSSDTGVPHWRQQSATKHLLCFLSLVWGFHRDLRRAQACPCGGLLLYTFRGLTSFPALTLWVGGVSQRLSGSQCPVSFTSTNTLPSRAFPKLPVELSQDGGLLSSGTPDNCPYCWDGQYRHGDMPLGY